jgi:arylsulfatase A-like enzyme
MKRHDILAGVSALGLLSSMNSFGEESIQRKPNVIFILADDLSAKEYSIYGGSGISTPNLDRMAKEGVAFKTAWAAPQCSPSRAMLHTGNYAYNTGWYGNVVMGPDFTKRDCIMGKIMQQSGYKTAWFEKQNFYDQMQSDPKAYGFDEYVLDLPWSGYTGPRQDLRNSGYMYDIQWYWHPSIVWNGKGIPTTANDFGPDIHAEKIIDFMTRHKDEPFFAYWAAFLPHMDYNDNQWSYTDVPELDANGNKTGKRVPGGLKADLEYLDHLVGQILAAVKDLGLEQNTIVMFAGDNGTSPYGKGLFDSEKGSRVPFVVWGPGLVKPRFMSDVLVDFTDVVPTLAELAGGSIPSSANLDGHSFAPYLLGKPFKEREMIFAQFYDGRWVRDKQYLLDARGDYYDCGNNRDESKGYRKMTMKTDPEKLPEVQKKFAEVLEKYPAPDVNDSKLPQQWKNYYRYNKPALLPENR